MLVGLHSAAKSFRASLPFGCRFSSLSTVKLAPALWRPGDFLAAPVPSVAFLAADLRAAPLLLVAVLLGTGPAPESSPFSVWASMSNPRAPTSAPNARTWTSSAAESLIAAAISAMRLIRSSYLSVPIYPPQTPWATECSHTPIIQRHG